MSNNASTPNPITDAENVLSEAKAVVDRLINAVDIPVTSEHDENDASAFQSQEDCGQNSDTQFNTSDSGQASGTTDQQVEVEDDSDLSPLIPFGQEFEGNQSVESLDEVSADDLLIGLIYEAVDNIDFSHFEAADDDVSSSSEDEVRFDDDFLPRDTSAETVGDADERERILAEIEFLERMMLYFRDAALMMEPEFEEQQQGSGDHVPDPELE